MKTADYYEIFPDKTIYSAQINWLSIYWPLLIESHLIESQLIDP